MAIEKNFNFNEIEPRLYAAWERANAFACDVKSAKQPYCIMMPPPNVTGSLHMGHGLTFTLQDILIRYNRLRGKDVLWQPGTDHAGIATQMMVEKKLAKEGRMRRDMTRDAFLDEVWKWKEESGGTITRQLRSLAASPDWARERFTMDEGLGKAVTKVFVTMYKEKLIYKDTRLVNWDPTMQTSISDLEVEMREVKGNLWHFKYPIENSDEFIVVATTRPETMLGDTGVAVHPSDERDKKLVGKFVVLPLVGRRIPIVADDYADPETGSGAVKITPAHDFNDFEVGKRNNLPKINIFNKNAYLNENVPEEYRGMERFEARKKIVEDLEALGLVEKIEPHVHTVPHGDRSGVPIEPFLSEQWYCDAKTLAQPAIKAVEEGRTKFVPQQWENTFFAWMRNIEPWCISRQLWWGHQIPAWYAQDGKVFVAESEEAALAEATAHYGKPVALKRDEDVLDTWFSSGLWPFSTLGWPEKTPELARYYPGDVLVTGFDIIFFWVARMMMMGIHFMGDVPFRTVYMHALVRDEKGQKMSKTKGNVIDPLDMVQQYGCDALRYTLANMSTPGRDIRLSPARIEGNRNFSTKIWNAARYCQMNDCVYSETFNPMSVTHTLNQWIVTATKEAVDKVAAQLDDYRFDLASSTAYDFLWNTFCDWYLEFTKPLLASGSEAVQGETRATTAWVLTQVLKILHPFMPSITEELWHQFAGRTNLLISASWPEIQALESGAAATQEIDWVIRLISTVRAVRAELNVPAGAKIQMALKGMNDATRKRLALYEPIIMRLARLSSIGETTEAPKGAAQSVIDEATIILPLADVIDLAQERARLSKESERLSAEIKKLEAKLSNDDFVKRAPPEVVDEQRQRKSDAEATLAKLSAAAKFLAG